MKKYVIAVDQSTSASKAFLVDARGEIVRRASLPHAQRYPAPGRVEHDAREIFQNVVQIIREVREGIPGGDIAALSITNQRETTVLWDRRTGEPVCPAVVWQDVRGESFCNAHAEQNALVHSLTGSGLSPYLPASKIAVLLDEQPGLRARAEAGEICMGTIESYLCFRLNGGSFVADVSNASRTQLLNLADLSWDERLLKLFGIPGCMLAESVIPCDGDFGFHEGIPITGVLGDSFAALYGQGCHEAGSAKVTYGTGSSVMMNLGDRPVIFAEGLTTAVAWSEGGRVAYETEGNITCAGDTLIYLRDNLRMFDSVDEIEKLAHTVSSADGVALVPAMSGLGAPYFDAGARAVLCGMNRGTTRAHVARAALESMAQQVADVFALMRRESGFSPRRLMADGGAVQNALLMQLQADLLNCELRCPNASELSALGAAYMGGIKTGLYADFDAIPARHQKPMSYQPKMREETREELRALWAKAVRRARI